FLLGVGVPPEAAFSTTPFHCDWLDTRESQRLLGFQQRSFADYLVDLHRRYRWRRPVVWAVAPLLRWAMLRGSAYWRGSPGLDIRRARTPARVGSCPLEPPASRPLLRAGPAPPTSPRTRSGSASSWSSTSSPRWPVSRRSWRRGLGWARPGCGHSWRRPRRAR